MSEEKKPDPAAETISDEELDQVSGGAAPSNDLTTNTDVKQTVTIKPSRFMPPPL